MTKASRSEEGYNLVEVLIAMAVFGIIAITIFTLFVMGRRNVYSGKQASQAVAIGTQVLEDLASFNKRAIYNGAFGIGDTDVGASVTLPRVSSATDPTFDHARVRSTDPNVMASAPADISTNPTGLLTRWSGMLTGKLANASVTLVLIPLEDTAQPPNNPAKFGTAQLLQVRVFVRWTETGRQREVILDTVKAY